MWSNMFEILWFMLCVMLKKYFPEFPQELLQHGEPYIAKQLSKVLEVQGQWEEEPGLQKRLPMPKRTAWNQVAVPGAGRSLHIPTQLEDLIYRKRTISWHWVIYRGCNTPRKQKGQSPLHWQPHFNYCLQTQSTTRGEKERRGTIPHQSFH